MKLKKYRPATELSLAVGLISFFVANSPAQAVGVFSIKSRTTGLDKTNAAELAVYDSFGTIADALEATINDGILSETLRTGLTTHFAKAGASPDSSLFVDRASDFSVTSITTGGQFNQSGTFNFSSSANAMPSAGAAGQGSVVIGIKANKLGIGSIGPIQGSRLSLYAHFFTFSQAISVVNLSMTNFGLDAQYAIVPGVGTSFLARWNGLHVASGFNYSSNTIALTSSLTQSSTSGTETVAFDMNYTLSSKTSTFWVPVEISTSATLLSFMTFSTGFGADLNFGTSKLLGDSTGTMTASTTATGLSSANLFSGTPTLDFTSAGNSAGISVIAPRLMIGGQFSLFALKFGGEYTYYTSGATGYAGWARIAI